MVGGNFDMVMDTLSQFLEFISSTVPMDQYASQLPSFSDLVNRYHITPSIALYIASPAIQHVREMTTAGSEVPEALSKWDATGVSSSTCC